MDLFARKIIAWTLSDTMEVSTVIKTIEKAKAIRNTYLPLIIHTDRGSQYVSQAWSEATKNMATAAILIKVILMTMSALNPSILS